MQEENVSPEKEYLKDWTLNVAKKSAQHHSGVVLLMVCNRCC